MIIDITVTMLLSGIPSPLHQITSFQRVLASTALDEAIFAFWESKVIAYCLSVVGRMDGLHREFMIGDSFFPFFTKHTSLDHVIVLLFSHCQ